MSERKKVLMTLNFSKDVIPGFDDLVKNFESQGFELEIGPSYRREPAEKLISALEGKYAFVIGGERMPRPVLEACNDLKILSRMGAGYDDIDIPAATELGIAVLVAPGANAPAVAEHAMAMMMAMTRRVTELNNRTRQGVWKPEFGIGLFRKTLGIIGLGAIGKLLAKYVSGFEMRVLAYDPIHDDAYAKARGIEYCSFERLIQESDFISLHCPINEDSRYIVSEKEFSMMKTGVQVVNCARGRLIDEKALYDAMVGGKVAGAALDCFEQEPVDTNNPLFTLNNVVASSHTAGMTYEVRGLVIQAAFQNVVDIFQGKKPRGLLNPEALKI
jgi:D-3-phosphoglycerate dehydrogenase